MEGKAMGSRTKNSVKNVFFSELSYAATLILQFANRSFFIRFLPEEYLSLSTADQCDGKIKGLCGSVWKIMQ